MALREVTKKPGEQSTTEIEHTDTGPYPYDYVQCTPNVHSDKPRSSYQFNQRKPENIQTGTATHDLPYGERSRREKSPREKSPRRVSFNIQDNPSYGTPVTQTELACEKQQNYTPRFNPTRVHDSISMTHWRRQQRQPAIPEPSQAPTSEDLYDDTISVTEPTKQHTYQNTLEDDEEELLRPRSHTTVERRPAIQRHSSKQMSLSELPVY